MPPVRSVSATKPVKTERTHEENQERAYIAASRRSDRSLEARVESARRASEIHKRRTGRSLRVTEQDVVNEEMYEEEDDDLPLQYRRLTAHLNSGDPHFNRRLASYLTNHVAMRAALDQAISSSYAQQYPNGQPWSQPLQGTPQQQSWMMNSQAQNQQQGQGQTMQQFPSPMMLPPNMPHRSPNSFRQTPYSMPSGQFQQASTHQRPMSISIPPLPTQSTDANVEHRRMSAPVVAPVHQQSQSPTLPRKNPSSSSLPSLAAGQSTVGPGIDTTKSTFTTSPQTFSPNNHTDMGPFATTLPHEAQMFLNSNYDTNSLFSPGSFMNAPEKSQQPFYSYNPNSFNANKSRNMHPSYDGMSQTLAPGALDNIADAFNWPTPPSASTDSGCTPFTPVQNNYPFEANFGDTGMKAAAYSIPSPIETPGEPEWATFLDPNSWADSAAA